MRFLILMLFLFPAIVFAQKRTSPVPSDSVAYYSHYIRSRYKQLLNSIKNAEDIKQADERLTYLSSQSDDYHSVNLYADVAGADFSHLNSTIVPEGFSPLKKALARVGFGFTGKHKGFMFDFDIATAGLNNKSKKGDETIKATFSNTIEFDLGYDVIKSQAVNIYPYAGLSVRNMMLVYDKPATTNGSYTDVTNIVQNDQSVNETANGLGYQAGIGFEFVLGTNKDKTYGTIFFLKGGTNGVFGNPAYKINGVKYDPQIKYGQWIVTAGFKFFGRKDKMPYDMGG